MDAQKLKHRRQLRRSSRVRAKITGTAERPRLTVFRSSKHIYVQLIDDMKGITKVAFDRGHFKYHGRLKALADAARANGLEF